MQSLLTGLPIFGVYWLLLSQECFHAGELALKQFEHVPLHVIVLCFLQGFRSFVYVKRAVDFSCAISFWLYSFCVKM